MNVSYNESELFHLDLLTMSNPKPKFFGTPKKAAVVKH